MELDHWRRREPVQQGRRRLLVLLSGLALAGAGCSSSSNPSYEQLIAYPLHYPASLSRDFYSRELADIQEIINLVKAQFKEESREDIPGLSPAEPPVTNYNKWLDRQTSVFIYARGERFVQGPRVRSGIFEAEDGADVKIGRYESFYGVSRPTIPIYRRVLGSRIFPLEQFSDDPIELMERRLGAFNFQPQVAKLTSERTIVENDGSTKTRVVVPFIYKDQYGRLTLQETGKPNEAGMQEKFSIVLSPREQLLDL